MITSDAKEASNPNAAPIPRMTKEAMIAQIEKDYTEAIAGLPTAMQQNKTDYGRMTKDICLMGLVKLYMHEKRWPEVITNCRILQGMGHSLEPNYANIFTVENNGNNQEKYLQSPVEWMLPLPIYGWLMPYQAIM